MEKDEISRKILKECKKLSQSANNIAIMFDNLYNTFGINSEEGESQEEYDKNDGEYYDKNYRKLHTKKSANDGGNFRKKKAIFGKVYEVQTLQNGVKKTGYRVHTKYMDLNHCIGPYKSFELATEVKDLIHVEVKKFNSNSPNVEEQVKIMLDKLKIEIDQKYPPVEMVRTVMKEKEK